MGKSKKEVIENLEKILKELKKKEEKPKNTEEYLKEISEKLSRLLEKNDIEKLKDIVRNPIREYISDFNYPLYPREIPDVLNYSIIDIDLSKF